MTLEFCPYCDKETENREERCWSCLRPREMLGVDLSGTESVRNPNKPDTIEEMMDRQFVPDTIEVPAQWLKKLIKLADTEYERYQYMLGYRTETKPSFLQHIDLIREKL